jgi:hypothetical protein
MTTKSCARRPRSTRSHPGRRARSLARSRAGTGAAATTPEGDPPAGEPAPVEPKPLCRDKAGGREHAALVRRFSDLRPVFMAGTHVVPGERRGCPRGGAFRHIPSPHRTPLEASRSGTRGPPLRDGIHRCAKHGFVPQDRRSSDPWTARARSTLRETAAAATPRSTTTCLHVSCTRRRGITHRHVSSCSGRRGSGSVGAALSSCYVAP